MQNEFLKVFFEFFKDIIMFLWTNNTWMQIGTMLVIDAKGSWIIQKRNSRMQYINFRDKYKNIFKYL